jgi:two-component system chemotaxis response regulator CheY
MSAGGLGRNSGYARVVHPGLLICLSASMIGLPSAYLTAIDMDEQPKKTMLVIDDDEAIRVWLSRMAESIGAVVAGLAENGEVGVEKFKELRPDLVMLDINMPVMGGREALTYILHEDPEAKVVILTSSSSMAMVSELFDIGAHHCLRKDLPPSEVKSTLKKILEEI